MMQTQSTRLQTISATQSLATVQTLLRAGLGCITYLRNLLPADNFNPSYFTSSDDSLSQQSCESDDATSELKLKRNVSGFKVMTVTRGFTEEADKLLNYLEYGIFDALQKQYLRNFIFAIYLDNKDPNNIVEAYTFNFKYHTVPGTDTVIPVMTLGEDGKANTRDSRSLDPVAEAARRGKVPTVGDVKKSVKALLKRLINTTTQMDSLPKRRYATFKLFYNDNTPSDYEPPHFQPGDVDKDKWFFTTHNKDEVPDKWSVGKMETGYHGVSVSVASVAAYLPSSTEDNNAPFIGITSGPQMFTTEYQGQLRTPVQEATLRAQQIDIQMKDADERNIVWSVGDEDAEGEDDPDYVRCADGTYSLVNNVHDSGVDVVLPIGLRNAKGEIEPVPTVGEKAGGDKAVNPALDDAVEAHFGGFSETVPNHVAQLKSKGTVEVSDLDQTQQVEFTQDVEYCSTPSRQDSLSSVTATDAFANIHIDSMPVSESRTPLPSSDIGQSFPSSLSSSSSVGNDIDTQMLKGMIVDTIEGTSETADTEMIDVEALEDSITSFGPSGAEGVAEGILATPKASIAIQEEEKLIDHGLDCECGITIEDQCCFCEGGCGRWYHVWCTGYHSTKDRRMPSEFVCFDCRVRGDSNWDLIKIDLYPKVISKFKDLALFRRAIKTAETYEPNNAAAFTKAIGCEMVLAHQLFKRLEVEGFIMAETTNTDDLGILETRSRTTRKSKSKGKQAKRKPLQKTRYVFNQSSTNSPEYSDYFNPCREVEGRLLGFSELNATFKTRNRRPETPAMLPPAILPQAESQTQEETQLQMFTHLTLAGPDHDANLKRKASTPEHATPRPAKKIKISVGPAVDLGD